MLTAIPKGMYAKKLKHGIGREVFIETNEHVCICFYLVGKETDSDDLPFSASESLGLVTP